MSIQIPLLSIIIPTRNRISFCISVIDSILNIPDTRMELVVQDNSDSHELEQHVKKNVTDKRLKYRYTSEAFSTIDNFNAGMELSTGEYVCFIGDDDGINPKIIEAASWAKKNQVDAMASQIKAVYLWPGSKVTSTFFTKAEAGSLSIYPYNGSKININITRELTAFLEGGGIYYLNFNLPKVYHGIVKRECMDMVKRKTGNYFGGLSPDIFSSMAISCTAKHIVVVDYPLTIGGQCPLAQTVHSNENQVKKIEDAPHFRNRESYIWNKQIPSIYSSKTIWLESAISALIAMGRLDLVSKLNLSKFTADCIIAYPDRSTQFYNYLINELKMKNQNVSISTIQLIINIFTNRTIQFCKRGWNRIFILLGINKTYHILNLNDMNAATIALKDQLQKNAIDFS